ncbi:MAG: hypothetical protein Q4A78_01645 [Peptostreptococcaceae bacterium]|nr:hypothetical protein [Peptostreptococcaceae bacterium]
MKKLICIVLTLTVFLSVRLYKDSKRDVYELAYIHRNLGALEYELKPFEKRTLYDRYSALAKMQFEREEKGLVDFLPREESLRESFNRQLNKLTYKYLFDITFSLRHQEEEEKEKEEKRREQAEALVEILRVYVKPQDMEKISHYYEEYKSTADSQVLEKIHEILLDYPRLNPDILIAQLESPVDIKAYFEIDAENKILWKELTAITGDRPTESEMRQYEILWQDVRKVFSDPMLSRVKNFVLYTDGPGETLAFVDDYAGEGKDWYVAVDIMDSYNETGLSEEFYLTMIHEYGHILTLSDEQVNYETEPVYGTYFEEGMSAKEDSYLNQFYRRFWPAIYEDGYIANTLENKNDAACFFFRHEDEFVTEYASSMVSEDICEAFAYFVTEEKPLGGSIREQKIQFFYEFPELIELRKAIRKSLELR